MGEGWVGGERLVKPGVLMDFKRLSFHSLSVLTITKIREGGGIEVRKP
jgi:hypothetical protein